MTDWGTPRTPPELADGHVQVWWARLANARPGLIDLLDPVERRRRERYRAVADQDRFLLGAALLRTVLGACQGVPPEQVRIARDCPDCGQPHGKTRSVAPGWECSVSHSGDRIAVAVGRAGPLGVDVEQVGREMDVDGLASRVLGRDEAAWVRAQPPTARAAAFVAYWTRKEAVIKATGDGLRADLGQIQVSPPDAEPRLLAAGFRPGLVGAIRMCRLRPGDGYAGTLAVLGAEPVAVAEFGAAELLGGG